MSDSSLKRKKWQGGQLLSSISVPPVSLTLPTSSAHHGHEGKTKWNYVSFLSGAKTTLKQPSSQSTSSNKRSRSEPVSSPASNHSTKKKPVCTIRNTSRKSTLPLLCESFELKYIIEGHSHLAQQTPSKSKQQKKPKKDTGTKKRLGRPTKDAEDNDTDSDSNEDDDDNQIDIWSCEFEPSPTSTPSTIVALCGGPFILLLDAQQGRYVKKYTHSEPSECFYSLAWTLLRGYRQLGRKQVDGKGKSKAKSVDNDEDNDTYATILASAGRLGSIKLLEPTQTHCYRYLFGHDQPVLKLTFAKKEPRWLLSSSMDKTVRLWDIGTTTTEMDDSCCLAYFSVGGLGHPTSMSISYDLSFLMVGTSNADLLKYDIKSAHVNDWYRSSYDSDDEEEEPLEIKPQCKFPHGDEWHEGYVEDVYVLGQDGDVNEINDYVVSHGSDDMEVLLWNPMTSTKTDADILLSMDWPDADDSTGLRFTIVEKDGQKLFLGGDYDGDIRLYNIGDGKISGTLEDGSKEVFDPLKVFSHESSTHLIRDVCVSDDTKKFVAVDSNNKVFVWSC